MREDMANDALLGRVIETAERNGWSVRVGEDGRISLGKMSASREYISLRVAYDGDMEGFLAEMENICESYDPDTEAYKCLDRNGHGKDGAPYRMRDVLDAKDEILGMIEDLTLELRRILPA